MALKINPTILNRIGNTPLVKINKIQSIAFNSNKNINNSLLKTINENIEINIFAKLESTNPSGSVKDRMAKYMVEDAEARGLLVPGGVIVENSSGNTGAALALMAAVKGYSCIITMPDKMSLEKKQFMESYGAKVVVTPTEVPPESEQSYYSVAKRIAKETKNSYYPDQYNNPKNIEAHYKTTGPEIWEQTEGNIDILVAGAGTGGTISGCARFLKEQNPNIKIIAVDPVGSVFYDYFKSKKLVTPHLYQVEGIGEDYLVKALDFSILDDMIQTQDQESFLMTRLLVREEGLFVGGSSGAAMVAALKVAENWVQYYDEEHLDNQYDARHGNGDKHRKRNSINIVVIFPDSGNRYLSKIFNDDWMKKKGFM